MIEHFYPGFHHEDFHGRKVEEVFLEDCPINGYLVSYAFKSNYSQVWGGNVEDGRKHYSHHNLKLFGDSGAFSFINEDTPPISVSDVIDFYNQIDVDIGSSLDHIVPDYDSGYDYFFGGISAPQKYQDRLEITIENGSKFLEECKKQDVRFQPIGAVQGWSPNSYIECIQAFQKMGYKKIGLGGIAKLHWLKIVEILKSLKNIIGETEIHLFGVIQPRLLRAANLPNITSVDGLGAMRNAVANYGQSYRYEEKYWQTFPSLDDLSEERRSSFERLMENQSVSLKDIDPFISELSNDYNLSKVSAAQRDLLLQRSLSERIWEKCPCSVCSDLGWRVLLNDKRYNHSRGFHNIYRMGMELRSLCL